MATESVLKELFEASKKSVLFKGMSDKDIWNACLSHADDSDENVRKAIENIHKKDQEAAEKTLEKQRNIAKSKEKIISLHEKEANDRAKDSQNAEETLENLFN